MSTQLFSKNISKVRFLSHLKLWVDGSTFLLFHRSVCSWGQLDSFSVSVRFDTSQIHEALSCSRTFSHLIYVAGAASRLVCLSLVPSPLVRQIKTPHCPPNVARPSSCTWQSLPHILSILVLTAQFSFHLPITYFLVVGLLLSLIHHFPLQLHESLDREIFILVF